jgi:hypothetical protein
MTPTNDSSPRPEELHTSKTPQDDPDAMSIVEDSTLKINREDPSIPLDTESDYGDFANDAEELEIIDTLLSEAENGQRLDASSLLVTDIEDYEPPKGVRLPKILGVEHTSYPREPSDQTLQDSGAQNSSTLYPAHLQHYH